MNMERKEGMDFGSRADFMLTQLAKEMNADKSLEGGSWKIEKGGAVAQVELAGPNAIKYEVKNSKTGVVIEKGMLDGLEEMPDRLSKRMHEAIEENMGVGRIAETDYNDEQIDPEVSDAIAKAQAGQRRDRAEAAVRGQERMGTSKTHVSGNVPTEVGRVDIPTRVDESETKLGVEPAVTQDLPYDEQITQTGEDRKAA